VPFSPPLEALWWPSLQMPIVPVLGRSSGAVSVAAFPGWEAPRRGDQWQRRGSRRASMLWA
jgi:hypothetical protein